MVNKILNAYNALRDFAYGAVAVQTHLSKYADYVITSVDQGTNEVSYDFTIVNYLFSEALESEDPIEALRDLLDFWQVPSYFHNGAEWGIDELISKVVCNVVMTPELRALCEEFKLNVAGTAYFTPNGTSGHDVIMAALATNGCMAGLATTLFMAARATIIWKAGPATIPMCSARATGMTR